jgi:hypothetical protein
MPNAACGTQALPEENSKSDPACENLARLAALKHARLKID